uniref:Putative LRR receptor-like serine/threonine-protein kinase n=1 Tax=Aegilops tauschii TaxID=37682 RepID=R7VZW7_AEGTA
MAADLGGLVLWRIGVRCADMHSRGRRMLSDVLVASMAERPGKVGALVSALKRLGGRWRRRHRECVGPVCAPNPVLAEQSCSLFHSMLVMADDTKFLLLVLLLSCSSLCFGSEADIQCLKSVQQSVNDPNGVLKSSWIFKNATEGYICLFTGVECWHPDENMIFSLRLGNLGLQAAFPRGLQNCSSVTDLDLSNNNFSGPIPQDISREMPYLTYLDLSYNSFSGPILQNISNMTYLNVLNLQHNQLSGEIPSQFDLLDRLVIFNVADSSLFAREEVWGFELCW